MSNKRMRPAETFSSISSPRKALSGRSYAGNKRMRPDVSSISSPRKGRNYGASECPPGYRKKECPVTESGLRNPFEDCGCEEGEIKELSSGLKDPFSESNRKNSNIMLGLYKRMPPPRRRYGLSSQMVGNRIRFAGMNSLSLPTFSNQAFPSHFRRYSQTDGNQAFLVRPVVLASATNVPDIGTAPLPINAKFKASESIPAAPADLPERYNFCIQENGSFIRHKDPTNSLHGVHVDGAFYDDPETGMRMCSAVLGGDDHVKVPACVDPQVAKEPVPSTCCLDAATSTLVCAFTDRGEEPSAYDGLVVEVIPGSEKVIEGIPYMAVRHADLPNGEAFVAICKPLEPEYEAMPCCIEEGTGKIVCPPDSPMIEFDGYVLPLNYLEFFTDTSGNRVCRVLCPVGDAMNEAEDVIKTICARISARTVFPACAIDGEIPKEIVPETDVKPEPIPEICCFDEASSAIICEGTPYHGLVVKLAEIVMMPDGTRAASVFHPSLPGGMATLPICDNILDTDIIPELLPPQVIPEAFPGACYDEESNELVLPDGSSFVVQVIRDMGDHVEFAYAEGVSIAPKCPPAALPLPPDDFEYVPEVFVDPIPEYVPEVFEDPIPEYIPEPDPIRPDVYGLPEGTCYDGETGMIIAPNSKYHGIMPQVVEVGAIRNGFPMIRVAHPFLPNGIADIPYCKGETYDHYDADESEDCFPAGRIYGSDARGATFSDAHRAFLKPGMRGFNPRARRYGSQENGFHFEGELDLDFGEKFNKSRFGKMLEEGVEFNGELDEGLIRRYGFSGDPRMIEEMHRNAAMQELSRDGFSRNSSSPGPRMAELHQGALCVQPWGPLGLTDPPNVSGDPSGYNHGRFTDDRSIFNALRELGYDERLGLIEMLQSFQTHYNLVTGAVASLPAMGRIDWAIVPTGNLRADGHAGPKTLNAIDIALFNQENGVDWIDVVDITTSMGNHGRERMYNAIEGRIR